MGIYQFALVGVVALVFLVSLTLMRHYSMSEETCLSPAFSASETSSASNTSGVSSSYREVHVLGAGDTRDLYTQRLCKLQQTSFPLMAIDAKFAETLIADVLAPIFETPRADFQSLSPPPLIRHRCSSFFAGDRPGGGDKITVVDLIIFSYELDLLEVRLLELWDVVDFFFITESSHAHSGVGKPLFFARNMKRFERFRDKIIYVPLTDAEEYQMVQARRGKLGANQDWAIESNSRTYLLHKLNKFLNANPLLANGFAISGDLDEMPSRELISQARHCAWPKNLKVLCVKSVFYQYTTEFVFRSDWPAPGFAYSLKFPNLVDFASIRGGNARTELRQHNYYGECIQDGFGGHFTYFGGLPGILMKALSIVETGPLRHMSILQDFERQLQMLMRFMMRSIILMVGLEPGWRGRIAKVGAIYGGDAFVPWAMKKNPKRYATYLGDFARC